ncbi:hypothetical protein Q7P35_004679 [Cladosporium inversicolor]
MLGRNGRPPVLREFSNGVSNSRGNVLVTGVHEGPDLVAEVDDRPELVAGVTDVLKGAVERVKIKSEIARVASLTFESGVEGEWEDLVVSARRTRSFQHHQGHSSEKWSVVVSRRSAKVNAVDLRIAFVVIRHTKQATIIWLAPAV